MDWSVEECDLINRELQNMEDVRGELGENT